MEDEKFNFDYKKLHPFKWYILENFPFLEDSIDALTNYQLFCKLGEEINKQIDVINTLGIQVEGLTDWFDNLDVQTEINNKLDKMASDGTLTALIGNYIDPKIAEQNANIQSFKNTINGEMTTLSNNVNTSIADFNHRLQSATSGSPLKATSTSEMTDTSRIYVNTSDGKWYYYDGDSWEIGGTYQATEIAENSINYNDLDTTLQNGLTSGTTTTDYLSTKDYYIDDTGHILANNNFYYYQIPVNPFETYILDIVFEAYAYGNSAPLYCFKNGNTFISKLSKADAISSGVLVNNHFHVTIDVPYNATTLLINSHGTQRNYILKVDKYVANNIHKKQLDTQLQTIFKDKYSTDGVSMSQFVEGAYIESIYTIQKVSGYSIYVADVEPGEKYQITVKQFYGNPFVVFSTNNNQRVETINSGTYIFNELVTPLKDSSSGTMDIVNYEFTIPDYCNKIYINRMNSSDAPVLKKSTSYSVALDDIDLSSIIDDINPLNNKTLLFTGDSICSATTSGVKGYVNIIAENNTTATTYNYGVDGATISVVSDNPTKNVVTYIQNMYDQHPDADYIILQGGVNDFFKNVPLGSYSEHSNFNGETPYDTTTFSGALEWIFNYCLTNFGGKKVGYIVTHKVSSGANFYQFMDRAKAICKKWSIPYIDLYEDSDLNYMVASQKANYSITNVDPAGDGLHPNLNGYNIITPKIENWLKYKI